MVAFVFKTKTMTHFKGIGTAVEKAVTIFQKKRKLGRRVRSHVKTGILVSLRLIMKRSTYVCLIKPD